MEITVDKITSQKLIRVIKIRYCRCIPAFSCTSLFKWLRRKQERKKKKKQAERQKLESAEK